MGAKDSLSVAIVRNMYQPRKLLTIDVADVSYDTSRSGMTQFIIVLPPARNGKRGGDDDEEN